MADTQNKLNDLLKKDQELREATKGVFSLESEKFTTEEAIAVAVPINDEWERINK